MVRGVAHDFAPRWAAELGAKAVPAQCGPLLAGLEAAITRYLAGFVELVQSETHALVDLKELVVKEMCEDKRTLVELFQRCGREELKFLTNSGLFFGFLLGCVQAAAWLFYDNPWTLTFGGALVGRLGLSFGCQLVKELVTLRQLAGGPAADAPSGSPPYQPLRDEACGAGSRQEPGDPAVHLTEFIPRSGFGVSS